MADEERYEADARRWLDSVDAPPPRLEVAQIVQTGRSQVRRRRLFTAGGTVAALAAVALIPAGMPGPSGGGGVSPASSAPLPLLDCDITELSLPDEFAEPEADAFPDVRVAAMDPTGRFVVGNGPYQRITKPDGREVYYDYQPNGMVLWDDGSPTAILPTRGGAWATDVNADGVVVGTGSHGPRDDYYPWIYRDGEISELPVPDGYVSADANAINTAGDVVGTVTGDSHSAAVVWPADDIDAPRVLTGPAGRGATAEGINDDGVIVGAISVRRDGAYWHEGAYLWDSDGSGERLPLPDTATEANVWAVRGDWAVGNVVLASPSGSELPEASPSAAGDVAAAAFTIRWDLSEGTFRLFDTDESAGLASTVSGDGDVLYEYLTALLDGEPYALPNPIDEGVIEMSNTASAPQVTTDAISDDRSTIVGTVSIEASEGTTDAVHPVMWRC